MARFIEDTPHLGCEVYDRIIAMILDNSHIVLESDDEVFLKVHEKASFSNIWRAVAL